MRNLGSSRSANGRVSNDGFRSIKITHEECLSGLGWLLLGVSSEATGSPILLDVSPPL